MTRLPGLLDADMREITCLHPLEMSLTMQLQPLSRAQLVLPPEDAEVRIGAWVAVYTPSDTAGVFRVTSVETDYADGLRTVRLEHGFGALADLAFPDETAEAQTLPADSLVRALLDRSGLWTLGACDYTETLTFDGMGTNLLSTLLWVSDQLADSRWVFDQSALPWRASLVRMDSAEAAGCEMRMTRSIAAMSVTLDRTELYTRVYPRGAGGLTIAEVNGGSPWLAENVDAWGEVDCVMLDMNETDPAQLKRKALARLHEHATPMVSVRIDGLALARETGEPMDQLAVGRVCRVPLPDYGTTIRERITELHWPDVLGAPRQVRVTLANQRKGLSALSGAGLEAQRTQTYRAAASGLRRMNGIDSVVKAQIDRLTLAETGIVQNEQAIALWAQRTEALDNGHSSMRAELRIQADAISAAVTKINVQQERVESFASELTQTAEQIRTRVTNAEFESYVIQTAQAIALKASRIELDALATTVSGILHGEEVLIAGDISCRDMSCNDLAAEGGAYVAGSMTVNGEGGLSVSGSITMGGATVATRNWVNNKLQTGVSTGELRATGIYLNGSALYKKPVTIGGVTHYLVAYGAG